MNTHRGQSAALEKQPMPVQPCRLNRKALQAGSVDKEHKKFTGVESDEKYRLDPFRRLPQLAFCGFTLYTTHSRQ